MKFMYGLLQVCRWLGAKQSYITQCFFINKFIITLIEAFEKTYLQFVLVKKPYKKVLSYFQILTYF
jgi:hypothetical protein